MVKEEPEASGIDKARVKMQKNCLLLAKLSKVFVPTKDKGSGLRIDVALFGPAWLRFEVRGVEKDSGRKHKE